MLGVRSYTLTFHSLVGCSQYLGLNQSMFEKNTVGTTSGFSLLQQQQQMDTASTRSITV